MRISRMLSFYGFLQLREVNVNGPKTGAAWMALKEATKTQSQAAGISRVLWDDFLIFLVTSCRST